MTTLRTFQEEINQIQHREVAKQRVQATADRERVLKDTKDKHKPPNIGDADKNEKKDSGEDDHEDFMDVDDAFQVRFRGICSALCYKFGRL